MVKFTSADDRRQSYRSTSSSKTKKSSSPKKSPTRNTVNNNNPNEFSGLTSKPFDSSKFTKAKNEQFYKAAEIPKFPTIAGGLLYGPLKKGAEVNRRFFADSDAKTPLLNKERKSVLDAGKYKPLGVTKSNVKGYKSKSLTQSDFESMSASQKEKTYKNYSKLRSEGKIDAYGNTSANFRREFIVHSNADGTKEYRETFLKTDNDRGNNSDTKLTRANVVTTKNVGGKSILTTEGKIDEDKKTKTKYDERETKKKGKRKNILTSQKGVMKTSADYSLGKKSLLGQVV